MTTLRIVADDVVELDGVPVARLIAELRLSLRDRLTETFDAVGEDEAYIAELEGRLAQLESQMTEPAR